MAQDGISIVIMAYNESETIAEALAEALAAAQSTGRPYEILVIDDGSTDDTGAKAAKLADELPGVRVIHHGVNRGMGGVYRTGFRHVKQDIVYFMAADLQPVPGDYMKTFLPILESHDIVVGYEPKRDAPVLSKALSLIEKLLFLVLFPGVPKIGGPMMFKRRILDVAKLRLMREEGDRSWMVLWELMIVAERLGFRITQTRAVRRARAAGESKGSTWRNAWHQLRGVLAFWAREQF